MEVFVVVVAVVVVDTGVGNDVWKPVLKIPPVVIVGRRVDVVRPVPTGKDVGKVGKVVGKGVGEDVAEDVRIGDDSTMTGDVRVDGVGPVHRARRKHTIIIIIWIFSVA